MNNWNSSLYIATMIIKIICPCMKIIESVQAALKLLPCSVIGALLFDHEIKTIAWKSEKVVSS